MHNRTLFFETRIRNWLGDEHWNWTLWKHLILTVSKTTESWLENKEGYGWNQVMNQYHGLLLTVIKIAMTIACFEEGYANQRTHRSILGQNCSSSLCAHPPKTRLPCPLSKLPRSERSRHLQDALGHQDRSVLGEVQEGSELRAGVTSRCHLQSARSHCHTEDFLDRKHDGDRWVRTVWSVTRSSIMLFVPF